MQRVEGGGLMAKKITVLIVDDSSYRRDAIEAMLITDPEIKIAGKAKDGQEAVEMARRLRPMVVTMDLKMPRMDGIEAIKAIMSKNPVPILIVSATVEDQARFTIKCLEFGAVDFVPLTYDTEKMTYELIYKVKMASRVRVVRHLRPEAAVRVKPLKAKEIEEVVTEVVAIAVSTGGPQALEKVLSSFPKDLPCGIVIVQHISAGFSKELSRWLDEKSKLQVKEAEAGDKIKPGLALVAPGEIHLIVEPGGYVRLSREPRELVHTPSADLMMASVARAYGSKALGVIMTGMGQDGVKGITAIREAGGQTLAQDEKSSMVYGMNKVAVESGIIDRVVPLERMASTIIEML